MIKGFIASFTPKNQSSMKTKTGVFEKATVPPNLNFTVTPANYRFIILRWLIGYEITRFFETELRLFLISHDTRNHTSVFARRHLFTVTDSVLTFYFGSTKHRTEHRAFENRSPGTTPSTASSTRIVGTEPRAPHRAPPGAHRCGAGAVRVETLVTELHVGFGNILTVFAKLLPFQSHKWSFLKLPYPIEVFLTL